MAGKSGVHRKLTRYRRKRDFAKTSEPRGTDSPPGGRSGLRFVVQKHAASHLHYDLRLELDGVMKSWAVPKGPSLDPSVKRLAVQVEDHPIEYNSFEGVIPAGEYGGGTVMLWDRGSYVAHGSSPEDTEEAVRRGYAEGKLDIVFHGERLRGGYTLVRTRGEDADKPAWLLMKRDDEYADRDRDLTGDVRTSVASGRTMEEIGHARTQVWHSNRTENTSARRATASARAPSHSPLPALPPMLATAATAAPSGSGWVFEPKYDGIRAIGAATGESAALISRNGNQKTSQFPEIADALRSLASVRGSSFVVDGEIIAVTGDVPARFQALQSRMHVADAGAIARHRRDTPVVYVLFDLLMEDDEVLLAEPWHVRRKRLLQLLLPPVAHVLRVSELLDDDAAGALTRARREGWEGVIAKRADAPYRPGVRGRDWLKLKIEQRQEFVVGGYTEPRNSRQHFGALLLGYYNSDGELIYAGHTGGGFTHGALQDMYRRLQRIERKSSPFHGPPPRTNERAHWVRPSIVVEVKFNEWTADGRLRQPIFVGVRDDKDPHDVVREPAYASTAPTTDSEVSRRRPRSTARKQNGIVAQIDRVEGEGGAGAISFGAAGSLPVNKLGKRFFPTTGHTKADLMRYYATVAPHLLPAIADRPLVLKRFPDGVSGPSFYQQKAPADAPDIVRVATVSDTGMTTQTKLIGGDLPTLLYVVQLGAISVDPWHSRVSSIDQADYAIIDLDPGPGATFRRVVQVARFVKEELDELGLHAVAKTSGASGIHIVMPLPPRVTNEQAKLLAELVVTRVAGRHRRETTLARSVAGRPRGTVYLDYLQNIRGKTVAAVYSVRAQPEPSVSTPLRWEELTDDLDPRELTIDNVPRRIADVGDLWQRAMRRPNNLERLVRHGFAA